MVLAGPVLAALVKNPYLRMNCLLWALLGLFISQLVWDASNNALRGLAPLYTFDVLAISLLSRQGAKPPEG